MWIDDYLRDTFTKELKRPTRCSYQEMLALKPRFGDGQVVKGRGMPSNVAWYTLELYLPTLLWGMVMDSFISADPDRKDLWRRRRLLQQQQRRQQEPLAPRSAGAKPSAWPHLQPPTGRAATRCGGNEGPLVKAVNRVLATGSEVSNDDVRALRADLRRTALRRIRTVYLRFRRLKIEPGVPASETSATGDTNHKSVQPGTLETFACLWAERRVALRLAGSLGCQATRAITGLSEEEQQEPMGRGDRRADQEVPMPTLSDLSPPVAEKLECVISDCIQYLRWVKLWPRMVQAIRSIRDGDLPSDILYHVRHPTSITPMRRAVVASVPSL